MIDLNDIAIFAKVAQLESFSRAARAFGMPVSTVSRRVTALDADSDDCGRGFRLNAAMHSD